MKNRQTVFIGNNCNTEFEQSEVNGKFVEIDNESYFMISAVNEIPPFFMSIVSDSNHWMFISSNGGITAGRKNADFSLFPYYTDDKITESVEITGSKSIFLVHKDDKSFLWEPFSERYSGVYKISRNLYKNTFGNKLIFEEINYDLELSFRYQWNSSNLFGFVKKSTLVNNALNEAHISILDGLQNIMPYGVPADLQNSTSCLVDAYKRSELIKETGLGIFALSAIIVDKAEPSEALKANIVWSLGLDNPSYLLSTRQLNDFRNGLPIQNEVDIKAEKGAYFVHSDVLLAAKEEKKWLVIANVNQSQSAIIGISEMIRSDMNLSLSIQEDINTGTQNLIQLVGSSDGLQLTEDKLRNVRHFSNTMFNIMRGGIFDNNYQIEKWDFSNYLSKANKEVFIAYEHIIHLLSTKFSSSKLQEIASNCIDKDFTRLCLEYMPLKFSRRHGDPSRPWNKFSINTRSEIDGSKILDYEGNWRDIFQNWEALVYSHPEFAESMIHKFLNATTFDGYNPYRVTKDGFDWEIIEPDNPWSFIGYWGDHQIIYLLKLLEVLEKHQPNKLEGLLNKELFVYANVPYKIKSYQDILINPKDTIEFDSKTDRKVQSKKSELGADGALLCTENGKIIHVTFLEKILATLLAKLSNFIPEAGIWMNTQRPEWNDANNALVGNGVSMVTLNYTRRFLHFFNRVFSVSQINELEISAELAELFNRIVASFDQFAYLLNGKINDKERKLVLDALGQAASDYRLNIYKNSFSGEKSTISMNQLKHFVVLSNEYLEHSIRANKRTDDLYHAYNIMTVTNENEISISYLSEMLEGQVAVLSSGYLEANEVVKLLDSLRNSKLYREDQNSYILYPNKELLGFIVKNNIPKTSVAKSDLLKQLVQNGNLQIIEKDINGNFHFNGGLKNAGDVRVALDSISTTEYASLVEKDKALVLQIFEEVFNHKAFTGRSGTFFGYEGLGSIYWHMVSKLQLAVQECCLKAIENDENIKTISSLKRHYYEINEGIGVHKPPTVYGAFSTDPYSHTPQGKGVKQPGMTGQVKEDILCRFGELGVVISEGKFSFKPFLIKRTEFLNEAKSFEYIDVNSIPKKINLDEKMLCFTYCQIPVIYKLSDKENIEVSMNNATILKLDSLQLDEDTSRKIMKRTGEVIQIVVSINESLLNYC